MSQSSTIACLLALALIASAASAAPQTRELMLCDFETNEGGLNLGGEFPGAEGQFNVVAAAAHDGKQGGRLSFDLTKGAYVAWGLESADAAGCRRTKPLRVGPRRCGRTARTLQDPRRDRPGPHAHLGRAAGGPVAAPQFPGRKDRRPLGWRQRRQASLANHVCAAWRRTRAQPNRRDRPGYAHGHHDRYAARAVGRAESHRAALRQSVCRRRDADVRFGHRHARRHAAALCGHVAGFRLARQRSRRTARRRSASRSRSCDCRRAASGWIWICTTRRTPRSRCGRALGSACSRDRTRRRAVGWAPLPMAVTAGIAATCATSICSAPPASAWCATSSAGRASRRPRAGTPPRRSWRATWTV